MDNREKFATFLKKNNLNQNSFCKIAEISPAALHRWFEKKQVSFRRDAVTRIVTACERILDESDLSREYKMEREDFK
jgi:hypothetical protein